MNIKSDTKLFQCKYHVRNFNIINASDTIELGPSSMLSLEYICDYDIAIFAILKVIIRVDTRKRIYILQNKRSIQVKLELDKIGMDINNEQFITNPELVFSGIFSCYFNDDDENLDLQALASRLKANESVNTLGDLNTENYFESQNVMEIYLFNQDLLKASRYLINQIYTKTTLQTAIGQMLTESKHGVGEHSRVLMSRPENSKIYYELLIPTNPVFRALLYLDQYYGLYRTGATVFYDINALYILNTNGKVTAQRLNEWVETNFLITTLDESIPGNAMLRQPTEAIYFPSIQESQINYQRPSLMNNASYGATTRLVMQDGISITNVKSDQEFIDVQNKTVAYIRKDNIFADTVIKARTDENGGTVYISGNNLDISAFTPNKTYRLTYDEPTKQNRYGKGKLYRLAYASHLIKLESEQYQVCSHHIVLKLASSR